MTTDASICKGIILRQGKPWRNIIPYFLYYLSPSCAFRSEEKVWIVLEGLRSEESIAARCQREGMPVNLYYRYIEDMRLDC